MLTALPFFILIALVFAGNLWLDHRDKKKNDDLDAEMAEIRKRLKEEGKA